MNDNEDMRLIVSKRGQYLMPVSAAQTWAQRYPDRRPLKGFEDHKFWPTPDGWVIARTSDENDA